MQDCHGKSGMQQDEGSSHQQIGLKFNEESSSVLYLEHGLLWCWDLEVDQKYMESFEMWCCARKEKIC